MSAWPATRRHDVLDPRSPDADRVSKASGPSTTPPWIWPRSAILHKAAASIVEAILVVDGFDCGKNRHFRLLDAQHVRQLDRVLHDVGLFLERRIDVDRRIP